MIGENWITKRRKILNISQEDLVELLSQNGVYVSRSSISHWENGKFTPPMDDAAFRRALSNALQMTIPDMLTEAGYEIKKDYSSKAMRAADIVDQLPPEQKELAMNLLEQMHKMYHSSQNALQGAE